MTKIRAAFDASAKSSSNVPLNDILLVGPTVYSPLIDVLLHFRLHRIAIPADVGKVYRAVKLVESDRDLHRFVWRSDTSKSLQDYQMTRLTFGVLTSSFAANMSLKHNALDHAMEFLKAAHAVETASYVDDCLTGANSVEEAIIYTSNYYITLSRVHGFLLRKWNSSDQTVLHHIEPEVCDVRSTHLITSLDEIQKHLEFNGLPTTIISV